MNDFDRADFEFLSANARAGEALGLPGFVHLAQPIGIWSYVRIANDITDLTGLSRPFDRLRAGSVRSVQLLDWGCGYGQMTYLLQRRGFAVTPFDIGPADARLPDVPLTQALPLIMHSLDPVSLPFDAASFDVVLSCGVLEHVDELSQPGNELKSLAEISRVLRPGGLFLIYQLPQRYAWQEAVIRRLRLGYSHSRRYHASEIAAMLQSAGFQVQRIRRANLIPKNLTGMPAGVRRLYNRFSRALIGLDGWLCRIPGLNRLAGVLEVKARKAGE